MDGRTYRQTDPNYRKASLLTRKFSSCIFLAFSFDNKINGVLIIKSFSFFLSLSLSLSISLSLSLSLSLIVFISITPRRLTYSEPLFTQQLSVQHFLTISALYNLSHFLDFSITPYPSVRQREKNGIYTCNEEREGTMDFLLQ